MTYVVWNVPLPQDGVIVDIRSSVQNAGARAQEAPKLYVPLVRTPGLPKFLANVGASYRLCTMDHGEGGRDRLLADSASAGARGQDSSSGKLAVLIDRLWASVVVHGDEHDMVLSRNGTGRAARDNGDALGQMS